MAVRRRVQTQTEAYWRRDFRLRPEDLESIYDLMLEDGRPRSLDDLVCEVMERHCRREAQARQSAEAQLYRPREHYVVGQEIVFKKSILADRIAIRALQYFRKVAIEFPFLPNFGGAARKHRYKRQGQQKNPQPASRIRRCSFIRHAQIAIHHVYWYFRPVIS